MALLQLFSRNGTFTEYNTAVLKDEGGGGDYEQID